jgi:hypothetical protein
MRIAQLDDQERAPAIGHLPHAIRTVALRSRPLECSPCALVGPSRLRGAFLGLSEGLLRVVQRLFRLAQRCGRALTLLLGALELSCRAFGGPARLGLGLAGGFQADGALAGL